jgi:hypothetical protein
MKISAAAVSSNLKKVSEKEKFAVNWDHAGFKD